MNELWRPCRQHRDQECRPREPHAAMVGIGRSADNVRNGIQTPEEVIGERLPQNRRQIAARCNKYSHRDAYTESLT